MKKILVAAVCLAGAFSLGAQACPPGTHPVGGTGPHHKGGTCVANHQKTPARPHHEAKPAKKPHAEAPQHQNKAPAPERNRTQQQPEQPPVNGPVNQAPGR